MIGNCFLVKIGSRGLVITSYPQNIPQFSSIWVSFKYLNAPLRTSFSLPYLQTKFFCSFKERLYMWWDFQALTVLVGVPFKTFHYSNASAEMGHPGCQCFKCGLSDTTHCCMVNSWLLYSEYHTYPNITWAGLGSFGCQSPPTHTHKITWGQLKSLGVTAYELQLTQVVFLIMEFYSRFVEHNYSFHIPLLKFIFGFRLVLQILCEFWLLMGWYHPHLW